ncbi:MAG: hypothetical protein LUD12_02405 [Lachnospiraceae bacterium]|nr:hypothetical protein [Lachnospiraceae bacterium]
MAKTNLKQYFPMIRTRQEIVAEINSKTHKKLLLYFRMKVGLQQRIPF